MEMKDRVIIGFYEENTDLIILNCLSKMTRRRNYSNKIKDMLLDYIKEHEPEMYKQAEKEIFHKDIKSTENKSSEKTKRKESETNSMMDAITKGIGGWNEK